MKETLEDAAARSGRLRSALLTAFWRGKKETKIERKQCMAGAAARVGKICCELLKVLLRGNKILGGCGYSHG